MTAQTMSPTHEQPTALSAPNEPTGDELLIAPLPVIAAIGGTALLLDIMSFFTRDPVATGYLSLMLFAVAGLAWLFSERHPRMTRWFLILALATLCILGEIWLAIPGALALLCIPTVLAMALLGKIEALATSVAGTMALSFLARSAGIPIEAALFGNWVALIVAYALYHSAERRSAEFQRYFYTAQAALDDARADSVTLKQTLADLAHANRQLTLMNDRIDHLRTIAEVAQKGKADFVAKVSHEFRTPLNMIIGLVDLLIETPEVYGRPLPPALMEDLEIVNRSCQHLSSLVNDVLDLAQVEAGRMVLSRERVDLGELISAAIPVVGPLMEKKNLSHQIVLEPDLPLVYCDRTRIRQVVLNLISNAARYTQRGGLSVGVRCRRGEVIVSVADTGPGIPPDELEYIFEPFSQGKSGQRERGGSGLGLSISKDFIERHGGQIWVESTVGQGATFSFRLPVDPPLPAPSRSTRWISENWTWLERTSRMSAPNPDVRPRVVVCDAAGELFRCFSRLTAEVEFVGTTDLAETEAELRGCPAHAVVLNVSGSDEMIPAGLEARKRLAGLPIITCSFMPPTSETVHSQADATLIKPILREDLSAVLQTLGRDVRRVLIVDDEADVRQLLARMLIAIDPKLEIVQAGNGEEALAALRETPVDVVLLDLVMPRMDGWQFLERKALDTRLDELAVVLISSHDTTPAPATAEGFVVTTAADLTHAQLLTCALALARPASRELASTPC